MEHLSTATVNAIVKQIKDLQKNPAEGITVRLFFCFGSREMRARDRERERERERRAKAVAFGNCGFFFFFFFPSLLLLLLSRTRRSLFTHPNLRYINAIKHR